MDIIWVRFVYYRSLKCLIHLMALKVNILIYNLMTCNNVKTIINDIVNSVAARFFKSMHIFFTLPSFFCVIWTKFKILLKSLSYWLPSQNQSIVKLIEIINLFKKKIELFYFISISYKDQVMIPIKKSMNRFTYC